MEEEAFEDAERNSNDIELIERAKKEFDRHPESCCGDHSKHTEFGCCSEGI